MKDFNVISLFSGALGLDLGLEKAGFTIRVCVELDEKAVESIKQNRPGIPVIHEDINLVSSKEILNTAGLTSKEVSLVVGGPPCQAFSTAGRRKAFDDPRGALVSQFIRVVRETRPKMFLMENVRGILSAAIKHRPIKYRGKGYPPLSEEEQKGSVFKLIINDFKSLGYNVTYKLVNSADYGVPQKRERVIIVGSRIGSDFIFPKHTHSKKPAGVLKPWVSLEHAFKCLDEPNPEYISYSEERLSFLKLVPPGGNWRSLTKELQPIAMGGAFNSGGGKVGFYRRLSFNEPSPTVTTSPYQKATDMCHPVKNRPLSVKEYARIQQFPDEWHFPGSTTDKYRLIGNAVPVGLGFAMGNALIEYLQCPPDEYSFNLETATNIE